MAAGGAQTATAGEQPSKSSSIEVPVVSPSLARSLLLAWHAADPAGCMFREFTSGDESGNIRLRRATPTTSKPSTGLPRLAALFEQAYSSA